MMKMWDIATRNQGGWGFASFVGIMNYLDFNSFKPRMHVQTLDKLVELLLRAFLKVINVFYIFTIISPWKYLVFH